MTAVAAITTVETAATDAVLLVATVDRLATEAHSPMGAKKIGGHHQRWIPLLYLRNALGWPTHRVGRVLRDLYATHDVWLRWPWRDTSLDDDNAAITIGGQSYHDITADPWR